MPDKPLQWHTLLTAAADQTMVVEALNRALAAHGYTPYDPFGLSFPPAFRKTVKLFVAPLANGWTRTVGEFDPVLLPAVSYLALTAFAEITQTDPAAPEARLSVWLGGQPLTTPDAIAAAAIELPHGDALADGVRALTAAQQQPRIIGLPDADAPTVGGIPASALPADTQAMLGNLPAQQVESLFGKLTGALSGKLNPAAADAARAALLATRINWAAPEPALLAAALTRLYRGTVDWRDPDFLTIRDAYHLHRRRRDHPAAPLYPGDAEALAAVPDALSYVPVYGGLI